MKQSLIDRLALSEKRIADMAEGLRQIASLDDPVGEILSMKVRPNGLRIGQKRVPLGVVGIIYESRPNVTADAFGLCFKTGNAVILRGGSDAIYSNQAIVRKVLYFSPLFPVLPLRQPHVLHGLQAFPYMIPSYAPFFPPDIRQYALLWLATTNFSYCITYHTFMPPFLRKTIFKRNRSVRGFLIDSINIFLI